MIKFLIRPQRKLRTKDPKVIKNILSDISKVASLDKANVLQTMMESRIMWERKKDKNGEINYMG